jgi:hypothetical protein
MEYKRSIKRKRRQERDRHSTEQERGTTGFRPTRSPVNSDLGRSYRPLSRPPTDWSNPANQGITLHSLPSREPLEVYRGVHVLRTLSHSISPRSSALQSDGHPSATYRNPLPLGRISYRGTTEVEPLGPHGNGFPIIPPGAYVNPAFFPTLHSPRQTPVVASQIQQQIDIMASIQRNDGEERLRLGKPSR